MPPRYGATRNYQVIAVIATDGGNILVEQVGTASHWPILNRETGQYRSPIWPHVAVVHCAFVSKLIPTCGTKKACAGISGTATEALDGDNLLSAHHIIGI